MLFYMGWKLGSSCFRFLDVETRLKVQKKAVVSSTVSLSRTPDNDKQCYKSKLKTMIPT